MTRTQGILGETFNDTHKEKDIGTTTIAVTTTILINNTVLN